MAISTLQSFILSLSFPFSPFLSFLCGQTPTQSLDEVGGENPNNRAGPKKLSRTVADIVYGRPAKAGKKSLQSSQSLWAAMRPRATSCNNQVCSSTHEDMNEGIAQPTANLFLSYFLAWQIPNFITGLSGWSAPD